MVKAGQQLRRLRRQDRGGHHPLRPGADHFPSRRTRRGRACCPSPSCASSSASTATACRCWVPRYLEVSIDTLVREQEKMRTQMAQAFGGSRPSVRSRDQVGAAEHGNVRAHLRDVRPPVRPARRHRGRARQDEARDRPTAARSKTSSGRWKTCRSGSTGWATRNPAAKRPESKE